MAEKSKSTSSKKKSGQKVPAWTKIQTVAGWKRSTQKVDKKKKGK